MSVAATMDTFEAQVRNDLTITSTYELNTAMRELAFTFRNMLASEYARDIPKRLTNTVFNFCWDAHHSNGYYEVENAYRSFFETYEKTE